MCYSPTMNYSYLYYHCRWTKSLRKVPWGDPYYHWVFTTGKWKSVKWAQDILPFLRQLCTHEHTDIYTNTGSLNKNEPVVYT